MADGPSTDEKIARGGDRRKDDAGYSGAERRQGDRRKDERAAKPKAG